MRSGHQNIFTHKIFDNIIIAYLDPKTYARCMVLNKHTREALTKSRFRKTYAEAHEAHIRFFAQGSLRHEAFCMLQVGDEEYSERLEIKNALTRISEHKETPADFKTISTAPRPDSYTNGWYYCVLTAGIIGIVGSSVATSYFAKDEYQKLSIPAFALGYIPLTCSGGSVIVSIVNCARNRIASRAEAGLRRGIGLFTRLLEQPAAADQEPDLESGKSYGSLQKGPSS